MLKITKFSIRRCRRSVVKELKAQNDQLTDKKIAQFECCGTKEAADKDVTEVCALTKAFEHAPPC